MEEGVLPGSTNLGTSSDAFMDWDYMDELLLRGCWLDIEANGAAEFTQFEASNPILPFESSFELPTMELSNVEAGKSLSKEEKHIPYFHENVLICQDQNALVSPFQAENQTVAHGSGPSGRWWIGPEDSTSVTERLLKALKKINDSLREKDVLIQVWIPVTKGDGERVLTASNPLFSLQPNCSRLANYREISMNFQFPAGEDSKGMGLPGRVFNTKVPESTPDVKFFTPDEYPRVGHALQYDIGGSLAVPVLERGSRTCLGVIEIVLTKQKIPELDRVCRALEAVNLGSYQVPGAETAKILDLTYQTVLREILEVLKSACTTHGFLAQTWVPCISLGKGGCRCSDDNSENCVSTVDAACYVSDPQFQGFHVASSDHHLLKGEGIVGRAFTTNQPCFDADVASYCKTEYPLSHHARMFGLHAAVAIRLRSICTGSADFVLEFFLPVNCRDPGEQKNMLTSLSTLIQDLCRSLRVVKDEELREKSSMLQEKLSNPPVMSFSKVPKVEQMHQESGKPAIHSREGITFDEIFSTSAGGNSIYLNKNGEKRRTKVDKIITLQMLRQHFAGSLKDAAKNIGVCPTTLKRICRQHGIQRWPSRKIKKVGHSLQKIQRVIDSVQGAAGVLQIESFYSNFPELASPNAVKTINTSNVDQTDIVKQLDVHTESHPPRVASVSPSSSCSHSSSSSQCWSSGTQTNSYALSLAPNQKSVAEEDYGDGPLKRTQSDANLHLSSSESKLLQSQSHLSFPRKAKQESFPLATDNGSMKSQEMSSHRVKVAFGDENIRFRMQQSWGYADLFHEICRRFGIDDDGGYQLKYLDDDAEWVLLTCDADLEECIIVFQSSPSDTIKLSLRDSHSQFGTPFSIRRSL